MENKRKKIAYSTSKGIKVVSKKRNTNTFLSPQIFSSIEENFKERGALKVTDFLEEVNKIFITNKQKSINSLKKLV